MPSTTCRLVSSWPSVSQLKWTASFAQVESSLIQYLSRPCSFFFYFRALDQTAPHVEAVREMLEVFPGAAKEADDEGYLPLHLALDCARPDPVISKLLLDVFPEAAFHKSKDGLLPMHCIISSMQPVRRLFIINKIVSRMILLKVVEVIESLLQIFPDSVESMALDVIPVDEVKEFMLKLFFHINVIFAER